MGFLQCTLPILQSVRMGLDQIYVAMKFPLQPVLRFSFVFQRVQVIQD